MTVVPVIWDVEIVIWTVGEIYGIDAIHGAMEEALVVVGQMETNGLDLITIVVVVGTDRIMAVALGKVQVEIPTGMEIRVVVVVMVVLAGVAVPQAMDLTQVVILGEVATDIVMATAMVVVVVTTTMDIRQVTVAVVVQDP